jgi:hypothetical protein
VRQFIVLATCLVAASASLAGPPKNVLVTFEGAINLDPSTAVASTTGVVSVVPNVVRGINPGGRPWVLRKLEATVSRNGTLSARGKGLLFGSGEFIGTRGTVTQVGATLTCGSADANATKFNTLTGFALDTAGNFSIRGPLSTDGINTAVMPETCTNPVLLIRSFNTTTGTLGNWFAAGIPGGDDD